MARKWRLGLRLEEESKKPRVKRKAPAKKKKKRKKKTATTTTTTTTTSTVKQTASSAGDALVSEEVRSVEDDASSQEVPDEGESQDVALW